MSDAPTRVALCDDHAIVRAGLRRILAEDARFEVIGDVGTVADAIALARETRPDVVVMDLGLPDGSGIDATREVVAASPSTRVLVLTVQSDVAYLRRAFDAGASGYLLKDAADVELVQAVLVVAAGGQYVHPTLGAALLAPDAPPTPVLSGPGGQLSEREIEVLKLIALGLTNPEIGERLYVSVRTVETHRAHLQQKLDVRSRAALVRIAREGGLLDDDHA